MKTLLERLKPEIKKNLLDQKDDYPTLVGGLLEILEENVSVTELKLGDLNNLTDFAPGYHNQVMDLYNMFND